MGKRREKKVEKNKQRKLGEKQEGKKRINQRKYIYSRICIINERVCIAIAFLETLTSLRNFQNY